MKKSIQIFTIIAAAAIFAVTYSCSGGSKKDKANDTIDTLEEVTPKDTVSVAPPAETTPKFLVITNKTVNMREKPNAKSKLVVELKKNDTCDILSKDTATATVSGKTDYWYKVKHKKHEGYIFGAFTSLSENVIEEPADKTTEKPKTEPKKTAHKNPTPTATKTPAETKKPAAKPAPVKK